MITTAELRKRLKTLECGSRTQETKIFFIDEGSDQALINAQWETVKYWEQIHPWGQAYVIVCEEIGPE